MSILDYIEKIKRENEGPRITAQEPRTLVADASTEMEQSPDSFLRPKRYDILTGLDVPAETLEDWDTSFRRPNAQGGRTMAQEPRNMAQGGVIGKPGGIVEEGVEYYSKKVTAGQPVGGVSEDFRTFLRGLDKKTLKTSQLANLMSSSKVDISKTLASNVLAEEEFLKIRPKRTLSKEDKTILEKLLKNKTGRMESVNYKGVDYYKGTEGRVHTKFNIKKDRPEAYKKVLATLREQRSKIKSKNVFPAPGDDLKKAIWRDLYESTKKRTFTQQAGGYKVPEPRLKVVSRPDNLTVSAVEDIVLLDTKTNKKIKYKNLEKYVDSLPNTSYKDLELPYKYKNWLTDQTIIYKGKTDVALRTVLRENLLTEGQLKNWKNSPYQIHHPFGINENPFKTQLAMHKANGQEGWIRLDTLKKLDQAGTNEKQIKKIMDSFKKKIEALPGGIQSGVRDELIGKSLAPDEFMKTLFSEAKIGREARPLVKDFLSSFWCGKKQSAAGGGRIGFSGSCPDSVKRRNFLMLTNDVSTKRVTGKAAKEIAEQAGKVVAKAGSKSALMSILGPAGIGLDIAFEVGSIGVDVAGGKSWNRALQDNWLTGAFIPGTGQEEFHKELYAKDSKAKPYGQALDLIDAYNKAQKNIDIIKQGTYRSRLQKEEALRVAERDLRGIEAQYNALTKHGKIMEEGSNEYENYMAAKTEFEDTAKAKSYGSAASLAYELEARESDRFKPREISPVKIDFKLPENYTTFEPNLPTTEDINKIWQAQGFEGKVPTDLAKEFITGEKWRQLFTDPKAAGIRGTQDWRGADGGLTRTVAPDSGPMSQGLRSLYINDRDY